VKNSISFRICFPIFSWIWYLYTFYQGLIRSCLFLGFSVAYAFFMAWIISTFLFFFVCVFIFFFPFLTFYLQFLFVCNSRPFRAASCLASQFRCTTSGFCIPSVQKCDGIVDCPDREDELDCPTPPPPGFLYFSNFMLFLLIICYLFIYLDVIHGNQWNLIHWSNQN
jgi:hypothetical protein